MRQRADGPGVAGPALGHGGNPSHNASPAPASASPIVSRTLAHHGSGGPGSDGSCARSTSASPAHRQVPAVDLRGQFPDPRDQVLDLSDESAAEAIRVLAGHRFRHSLIHAGFCSSSPGSRATAKAYRHARTFPLWPGTGTAPYEVGCGSSPSYRTSRWSYGARTPRCAPSLPPRPYVASPAALACLVVILRAETVQAPRRVLQARRDRLLADLPHLAVRPRLLADAHVG